MLIYWIKNICVFNVFYLFLVIMNSNIDDKCNNNKNRNDFRERLSRLKLSSNNVYIEKCDPKILRRILLSAIAKFFIHFQTSSLILYAVANRYIGMRSGVSREFQAHIFFNHVRFLGFSLFRWRPKMNKANTAGF